MEQELRHQEFEISHELRLSSRNIFELTEQQQEQLREQADSNKGKARIIIHPFFSRNVGPYKIRDIYDGNYTYDPLTDPTRPKIHVVEQTTKRMVSPANNDSTPIFIFEDIRHIPNTEQTLGNLKDSVYLVPTQSAQQQRAGTPEPYIEPNPNRDPKIADQNWEVLIKIFHESNINHIIIGGAKLDANHMRMMGDQEKLSYEDLQGCVGITINELKNHFELEISNLVEGNAEQYSSQ